MKKTGYWTIFAAAAVMALILTACGAAPLEENRTETLRQYETIVRWSQWDSAVDFLAPEYLEEHPITRLDMDRLRLFRVTAYTVRGMAMFDNGKTLRQEVEIRMYNQHQAVERAVIDEQEWRYSDKYKRWLLWSGLPDVTQRN